MALFYNQADQDIYTGGDHFIPQQQYRLGNFNTTVPTTETQQVNQSYGVPYTGAFTNSNVNRDNNRAALGPYTAQPSGNYVTNRTAYGSSGYLRGTEPEENYMQKIGGMIKSGIGMAIPGGNFLMNMAGKLDNFKNLSPADQEFARQQMSFDEQSVHPGGRNIGGKDRYGYNKRSMFGNYADKVKERADIAREFAEKYKDDPKYKPRDIDQYYLDKEEEQKNLINQMKINDRKILRYSADKLRAQQAKGIKTSYKPDIHGGGEGTSKIDTGSTYEGPIEHDFDPKQGGKAAEPGTPGGWYPGARDGGRIGYKKGGRQDPMGGTMEQTAQELREVAPDQFAGGMNISHGGGDGSQPNDNIVIPPKDNLTVDTDFMSTQPSMELMYSPSELAKIKARLYNQDITSEDDINLEGEFTGGNNLIDYGIDFTGEGITGSHVGAGPFKLNVDPYKNLNLDYSNTINDWDINARTNLKDAASLSASKNGWNIGLTHGPQGTDTTLGWSTAFGQPERKYNTTSILAQNPDLIYGIEGQNLRYGGLASIL